MSSRSRRCTRNMVWLHYRFPLSPFASKTRHVLIFGLIGPIIRITPNELSISDPEAYSEIYVVESKRRTDNYDIFCKGIDMDGKH